MIRFHPVPFPTRGRDPEPLAAQLVTLLHVARVAERVMLDSAPLAALLREGWVETWYQPIFWSGTLGLWGYECLMRGVAPDGSRVSPAIGPVHGAGLTAARRGPPSSPRSGGGRTDFPLP